MELTGLWEPGDVRVLVAPEGSPLARRAPSWAVAYADPPAGTVVLIPTRTPVWPDDGLPDVVRHEVAHVLTFRAAGGRMVPRWFDEGLAMAAGRERVIEDDVREALADPDRAAPEVRAGRRALPGGAERREPGLLALLRLLRRPPRPARLRLPAAGPPPDGRGRAVRGGVPERHGRRIPRRDGRTSGRRAGASERWLPILTSTAAVWLAIVLLSAWAVRVVRGRRAARLAAWEAEERAALQDEPLEAGLLQDGDDVGAEGDEDRKKVEDPPLVN